MTYVDNSGAPNGYTEPTLHRYRQLVKRGGATEVETATAEESAPAKL